MKLQHQTTIDGLEVTSSLLDYDEAADISLEIIQKISPLVQLFMLDDTDMRDEKKLQAAALPLIMAAAQSMKSAEWGALVRRLLERTSVVGTNAKGEKANLDLRTADARNQVFQGRVLTSYKVVLFVIQINFADFGGALGQLGITVKGT